MQSNFTTRLSAPCVTDFIALRERVGWGNLQPDLAASSLRNTLFHVTIYQCDHQGTENLAAMGRVIGDGSLYFYIQDVVVSPDFQGIGLGAEVMQAIESYLAETVTTGATVGLLAAKGKEAFYEQFGYQRRDGEAMGLGMCRFVK